MRIVKLLLIATAAQLLSCSSSKTVSIPITQPGEITLPSEANTILLVDRTKLSNEMFNLLEGILTGEMPSDDRVAAHEAMANLKSKLDYSPRFNVKIHPDRLIGNSMSGTFPPALSWEQINQLAQNNQAEIVVCLELFDSDFIVTHGSRIKKRSVGKGTERRDEDYTEYYAKGVGNIKMGFRSYYNNTRTIVDQQIITKNHSWEGAGSTPGDAVLALISKSNANKQLAGMVGQKYAQKISPLPGYVSRSFYKKGKDANEVAAGTRLADVSKWKEAIDTWKAGLQKAEEKDAGRIAYNIAVGYEVLGEYGTALSWAQDSYTKYGNKKGRELVRLIQGRINDEEILKRQMGK